MELTLPSKQDLVKFFWEFKCGWITCICLLLLTLPLETFVKPFHRPFRLDDPQIGYPFDYQEQVPAWLLVILAVLLPVVVFFGCCSTIPRLSKKLNITLLGFTFASLLNLFVTDIMKFMIGNPRPDFLARCIPQQGTSSSSYVNTDVCTTTNVGRLEEGFRSTPSGHSSVAFCGLLYLTLWISGQFRTYAKDTALYWTCLSISPLLLALYISLTRLEDFRHHWYDVLLGMIVGSSIAVYSYLKIHPGNKDDDDDDYNDSVV